MNRIILIFILFLVVQKSNGQLNEHFNDIKATFKSDKQKELTIIENKLNDAEIKNADAQQKFLSGEISKGLNESKKIANIYSKNYRSLFLIYEEKLDSALKSLEGNKSDYVNYIIREAKNSFRISISERLLALKENNKKKAFNLLNSAHKNEIDAINFQSQAFGVINGWINDNFKIKKEKYTYDNLYNNTTTDSFKAKDFTEKEISIPNNYLNNKNNINEKNNNTINKQKENTTPSNINIANNKNIEFRIQIGTSILPASKSQIDRLNSTNLDVKTYKSNVYYKYTIGSFDSYEEAKYFKNAYGLKKTYIAEYKNGKEVKFYYRDI